MLVTSRMFPAEKVMFWIASGYSSCILMGCFVVLFGRMRRSVRFTLMFASVFSLTYQDRAAAIWQKASAKLPLS